MSPQCTHSKTTPEAALELISYSIVVVENFGPPLSEDGETISYPRYHHVNYKLLQSFLDLRHFLGL